MHKCMDRSKFSTTSVSKEVHFRVHGCHYGQLFFYTLEDKLVFETPAAAVLSR